MSSTHGRPLVLLVEDDDDIRFLLELQLEAQGLAVVSAADGSAALDLCRAVSPSLALLDVTLPGMTGLEICRALRSDPELSSTKVIMLTARAQESDMAAGMVAGADEYLVKPFGLEELRRALGRQLPELVA